MASSRVIPLHPYNTIEIDDTRLQAMWRSHDRRQGMIYGVLGLAGVAAILLTVAAVVWAAKSSQPAPVINITVPERPLRPPEPPPFVRGKGAPPIVTEYATFKNVDVGDITVQTGWQYHNSTDTVPYKQECHAFIGATGQLELAINGQPWEFLARDARARNLPEAQAQALVKECQWYPA
jgi:hypothetical protein